MSLLRGILPSTLYVRVQPNRFLVRHIQSGREVVADAVEPFTTTRLLIGEFGPALDTLQRGMREVRYGIPFFSAPSTIIHPLSMIDGGLSAVEHRVMMEVADSAGSKRVLVWLGPELSDADVREKARAA